MVGYVNDHKSEGGVGGAMNEGEDTLGQGYHNSRNGMMRSDAGEDSSLLLA